MIGLQKEKKKVVLFYFTTVCQGKVVDQVDKLMGNLGVLGKKGFVFVVNHLE